MKTFLAMIAFLIVLGPTVAAAQPPYTCDGSRLLITSTTDINVSGNIYPIVTTEYVDCPFGCEENLTAYGADCVPNPLISMTLALGLVMFFLFLIFTLPYLYKKRKGGGRGR